VSRAEVDFRIKGGGGLPERFEVEARSGKRQRSTDEYYSDEKKVDIEPLVAIKNPDANIHTHAVKVTALLLGPSVATRNAIHVFSIGNSNLPLLEGGKEGVFQMKPLSSALHKRVTELSNPGSPN
jgi:hypothetical protein